METKIRPANASRIDSYNSSEQNVSERFASPKGIERERGGRERVGGRERERGRLVNELARDQIPRVTRLVNWG